MYNVSNEFRSIMKKSAQQRRLYGTIGGTEFTQKNVLQGTFVITNQCSDNSNIQIGQVYTGELKATFRGLNIPRNKWKGKEIISYQGLKLENDFEDVLLGHYFIDDAKWTKAGVTITAYDIMSKFDKAASLTSASGKVYDFIIMCCDACGVTFGMTEDDLLNFANGNAILGIFEENDIQTYRDLLSWCAQSLGANALINREGKLILKQYKENIDDTFTSTQRLDGGKFSDFDSYYTGLSCVNIANQTTSYYGAEVDDGLTMNLGSNPLLQLGTDEVKEKQRRAILESIQKIDYTPMTMKLNTPYIYDLMDVIEFTDGILGEGEKIKSCITKFTWKFNGDYEVECSGSDPALANGRSKTDKNISGLIGKVDSSKTITYKFINATELNVSETAVKIISIAFTSKEKATAMFLAEILLDIKANSIEKEISGIALYDDASEKQVKFTFTDKTHPIIEVNYKMNNELVDTFIPKQVYHDGSQILTLYYPLLSIPDDLTNTFEVYLKITDGTAKISKASAIATITGQGLVADYYEWDGNINIEEKFSMININTDKFTVDKMRDNAEAKLLFDSKTAISDNIPLISISSINFEIDNIKSSVDIAEIIKSQTVKFDLNEYTMKNINNRICLKTDYCYTEQVEDIDAGKLTVVDIITDDKKSIESLEIKER